MATRVEALIEMAYAAVYDAARWQDVLDQFCVLTGADAGALHAPLLDAAFAPAFYLTHNVDLTPVLDRHHLYQRQAPFTARALAAGLAPGVFVNSDVISQEDLHATDYYREYMRPLNIEHGLHCIYRLPAEGGAPPVVMSVTRSLGKSPFGEPEIALAREIFPHLRRAVGLSLSLQPAKVIDQALESALNAFDTAFCLVGPGGRLVFANATAQALFEADAGLSARQERLQALDATADTELQAAILRAIGPAAAGVERATTEVALRLPSGEGPLVAIVAPLGQANPFMGQAAPCAAVYLVDAQIRPLGSAERSRLRAVFALTDAEAAVTARLIEGRSAREIAEERGTSEQTVRTQIKLILEKTQSARQGDLQRLQRLFVAKPELRPGPAGAQRRA